MSGPINLTPVATKLIANLPPPSPKRLALRVSKAAEKQLRGGHPWLFDQAIQQQKQDGRAGDLAVVFDQKKKFLAVGLYDPASPIRVKILQHNTPAKIDQAWFTAKLREAAERRAALPEQETTGYRLVYGEADGLPSLIIDRYADTLVIKLYSAGWLPHFGTLLTAIDDVCPAERWILRLSRNLQSAGAFGLTDGMVLRGTVPDAPIEFIENGLTFAADVVHGHKTGFFFDHRDNRQRVGRLAKGKRVLDVFAYSGGFSAYAAAGGAKEVTSLDISEPALRDAAANVARNAPDVPHYSVAGDAFSELAKLAGQGVVFDLVIVDPPAFAKSQKEVGRAVSSYARLTHLALTLVAPGGILVMASCSSRVKPDQFFTAVFAAAEEVERPLWEHFRTGHAIDHPVVDRFPEGEYLKCLYASPID